MDSSYGTQLGHLKDEDRHSFCWVLKPKAFKNLTFIWADNLASLEKAIDFLHSVAQLRFLLPVWDICFCSGPTQSPIPQFFSHQTLSALASSKSFSTIKLTLLTSCDSKILAFLSYILPWARHRSLTTATPEATSCHSIHEIHIAAAGLGVSVVHKEYNLDMVDLLLFRSASVFHCTLS